jgi:proteasome lid subunit RPN8/RPN11
MSEQLRPAAQLPWSATPLLLKREDFEWPEGERMFYLLSSSGLFICRNHEFFRSCVPAPRGPSELEEQEPFLECGFPRIPQRTFERIVGFFDRIRHLHNSEASVLLAYDRTHRRVRIVVPEQTATVVRYSDGYQYPIGLYYYPPTDLPQDWVIFGDVHSHVDMSAYSSGTDVADETHSAGLHIVVGRLSREPMECHVEAVVDGERFALELEQVLEGYGTRAPGVPRKWIERVKIQASPAWSGETGTYHGTGNDTGQAGTGEASS